MNNFRKRSYLGLAGVCCLLFIGPVGCDRVTPPEPSQPSPSVGHTAATPSEHTAVSELHGFYALLDFWAPWSRASVSERVALKRLHSEFEAQDVRFVGFVFDRGEPDAVRQMVMAHEMSYPVYSVDESIEKQFGPLRVVPTKLLLDPNGRVLKRYEGAVDLEDVKRDITAHLPIL